MFCNVFYFNYFSVKVFKTFVYLATVSTGKNLHFEKVRKKPVEEFKFFCGQVKVALDFMELSHLQCLLKYVLVVSNMQLNLIKSVVII